MLVTARELVDRYLRMRQQPRSRVDEILHLKRRFDQVGQAGPAAAPPDEVTAAGRLRELRLRLSALVGAVQSCRTCAKGHPPPHGRFDGGHCCGLRTEDAFNDDEVAALRLAGTRPADLRPPPAAAGNDHAGCAFRGQRGCSLAVPDRPNLCLRYLCPDLTRELWQRDPAVLAEIERVNGEMEAVYLAFIHSRAERAADAMIDGP